MIIDCRTDEGYAAYLKAFPNRAIVIDTETGKEIKEFIYYADDVVGEYKFYRTRNGILQLNVGAYALEGIHVKGVPGCIRIVAKEAAHA